LVSDFTPQQQAEAVAAASASATNGTENEDGSKQVYHMNSMYDLSVVNNRTARKQSAKQRAVADGINSQQQQKQQQQGGNKNNKKNKKDKKDKNKQHQQQKRQKQKKMNDFITKELSKLNL